MAPMRGGRGRRGARGERGATGARGERGPAGPSLTRAQILDAVQAEFAELKKQLQIQIERTGQMQQQLDAIHNLLKRALKEPEDA